MFKDDDRIIWNSKYKDVPNNILPNKFYTVYHVIDIDGGDPYMCIYDECKSIVKDICKFIHRDEFIQKEHGYFIGQEIYYKDEKSEIYEKGVIDIFTAFGVEKDMIICFDKDSSMMLYLDSILSIEEYRNKIIRELLD